MLGEVIATEVGFLNNVFLDFGVYDMRQKNEASRDPAWAGAHSQFPADSYGICWLNSLPQADSLAVKSLPSRDGTKNGRRPVKRSFIDPCSHSQQSFHCRHMAAVCRDMQWGELAELVFLAQTPTTRRDRTIDDCRLSSENGQQ